MKRKTTTSEEKQADTDKRWRETFEICIISTIEAGRNLNTLSANYRGCVAHTKLLKDL